MSSRPAVHIQDQIAAVMRAAAEAAKDPHTGVAYLTALHAALETLKRVEAMVPLLPEPAP